MTKRIPLAVAMVAGVVLVASCGNDDDVPMLAGNTQAASAEGEALYQKAKAADDRGKHSSAIKQYAKVADKYPFAPSSSQARLRQAELLEQDGEVVKSFDAYQKFLTRYQGSGMYAKALDKQAKMAQSAADGDVKSSFAGLKSKLSTEKTVEMLSKVRDNAPRSATSAKAQFTIGELYQSNDEAKDAIEAYRKLVRDQPESSYAPEALFRVGVVLMEEADRGNRNQATLDLAGEAFSDYLLQYPGHSKNAEARSMSKSLGGKDLQRSFEIAEFYDKSGQFESAKIYYRDVVKRSASGEAHDKAKARLKALGE
jgi:outer membrane protein assembly factor BamD (BamD/ComL family)